MPTTIIFKEIPDVDDEKVLFDGLNQHSLAAKGMAPIQPFGLFVRDEKGALIGGAKAQTYYGCLYVDILWIDERYRHQGLGTKLMLEAERIGKERNCHFATVCSMDWEASAFYQKLGYQIEYVREGYDKGSKMYFLRKNL
jgi:ribosomal protein S18 acetylase RimI-like enzyme